MTLHYAQDIALFRLEKDLVTAVQDWLEHVFGRDAQWKALQVDFMLKAGCQELGRLDQLDLSKTMGLVCRSRSAIVARLGSLGHELTDRADLIKFARNRYSHRTVNTVIAAEDQIGDLSNARRLIRIIAQDHPHRELISQLNSSIDDGIKDLLPQLAETLQVELTAGPAAPNVDDSPATVRRPDQTGPTPDAASSLEITSVLSRVASEVAALAASMDSCQAKVEAAIQANGRVAAYFDRMEATIREETEAERIAAEQDRERKLQQELEEELCLLEAEADDAVEVMFTMTDIGADPGAVLDHLRPLSVTEARGVLIALREAVLDKNPWLSRRKGLLRRSLLDAMLETRVQTEEELRSRLPALRRVDPGWLPLIPVVVTILKRIE